MPKPRGSSVSEEPASDDPDEALLQRIITILRQARVSQNITLRDLTVRMKVNNAHLSRAERGLAHPGFVVLVRWCRALDLKFESVLKDAMASLKK